MILTKNEQRTLPSAIGSLPAGIPVLVLDAESTDATRALAGELGARVIERPWTDFVDARRFALAAVGTPWTLMLDADEALDDRLRAAILALPEDPPEDAFRLARTTWLCDRPVRGCGWGDERLVRLMRTAAARLEARPAAGGAAALHERWHVAGPVRDLPGRLTHRSYPDLASYLRKFDRYTSLEAAALASAEASAAAFAAAALRAPLRAAWLFVGRGGVRDGWRGAFVSVMSAAYPAVVRWKARAHREDRGR